MRKSYKAGFLACTAIVPMLQSTSALAQALPPSKEADSQTGEGDIVVTGSRIQRVDLDTASPVNVISQDEIGVRQPDTAEALLRDLPSVRPSFGPGVNNGGDGSSSVDLRGLGTNRTLVLVDGRRVVPFGLDGITDLNTIPVALLERVDIVTGGASSVYGADAVAGVVNFITKRNFEGVELSGSYGVTQRGDASQYRVDLLTGANFADGRGNVVLGLGYSNRSALPVTDRAIGAIPISSANGLFTGSANTTPVLFTAPNSVALGLGQTPGSAGSILDFATGRLRPATSEDLYNTNEGTYFSTPLERYNAYAAASYEITPGIELYSSAMFTRNKATIQLAPSGSFSNTYRLPLSNAFLPGGVREQLCTSAKLNAAQCAAAGTATTPGSSGYLEVPVIAQRRFVEFGSRGSPFESTQFQLQAGLRGDVADSLRYDISTQYGETNQDQARTNYGSFSRLQQALRSYRSGANEPVCSDPSGGCVAFNLFGPVGSITPDMLQFIDLDPFVRRQVSLSVTTASLSGDLFGLKSPLSSKEIAFSIGGEYRKLSAKSTPDAPSQVQGEVLGTGTRQPPDQGTIKSKELFGELIVPLIDDRAFFYSLSFEGGVRYSDYNTTGGSVTYKLGGTYQPVRDLKFRGMFQRAVRSPNIIELFQSSVPGLGNLAVDPCQGSLPVGNASLSNLCILTGAPSGTIGSIPTPSSSQIVITNSGNRDLGVERANTITLGAVLTPSFVPNLSLTVDYYKIKVEDAITAPATGDILNGCYSVALNPELEYNAFCRQIGRNPLNGSLNGAADTAGVILSGSNLGTIETAGFDVSINYRYNLGQIMSGDAGNIFIRSNATYLDYYRFQATPNSINRDCTGFYSTNCTNPRPKFRSNVRFGYDRGPFEISILWTHLSGVALEPYNAAAVLPLSTPQPGGPNPIATTTVNGVPQNGVLQEFRSIKPTDYFDLAVRIDVSPKLRFNLTVENLFDKGAPNVGSNVGGTTFNNGNTFPTVYDVLGRRFMMGARLQF